MRRIRVLIVDDSTVIRRLLSNVLSEDCEIEVVATAANGKIALAKLPQIKPDVVTLDIEMPEMDGIETLQELRKVYPDLPVIMFSTLTARGAESTLDALSKGASDYVTKPANVGSVTDAMQSVRIDLVPKIKHLCKWYNDKTRALDIAPIRRASVPTIRNATPSKRLQRVDVVAIGVSTGGPNALLQVLPKLAADFPVPIVIVQHMPPLFTKHLADRLNQKCAIQVVEGTAGERLQAGTAYIAPGDWHMQVCQSAAAPELEMNQEPRENSCRPAVDVLFRSVAEVYGAHALSLVLTGMGQDGLHGTELVRAAGGMVIAQDEASSVVWGMPRAIVVAGLADQVLPLDAIAAELCVACQRGRTFRAREKALS